MSSAQGWRDLTVGGIIPTPGTARSYETGDWRNVRPLHSKEKCINCLICWLYCPDAAIVVKDGKVLGIDYAHCKGCGICARECPDKVHAIEMVNEAEWEEMKDNKE
ncbi:MAG TPA: 4Fe-4S binding protein [Firmicutes bacterium]|nr:4Fe-4S binding protein [Bacillota bacterium]HOQ24451.1 4Fe-4S binding protein [Bacillota bacterium]HPT67767.1 4Fe-4S binding protein [Bacillota bacterium]